MKVGTTIMNLRKEKGWSQTDLAKASSISREIIGKYERDEAVPSIEFAKRIADALGVSLDYLAGKEDNSDLLKDADMVRRIKDISNMPPKEKECVLYNLDAVIRDFKARQTYATK
jgi:transcriptional regulator with XRE-family HTH domain